jgi:hypothetical protein
VVEHLHFTITTLYPGSYPDIRVRHLHRKLSLHVLCLYSRLAPRPQLLQAGQYHLHRHDIIHLLSRFVIEHLENRFRAAVELVGRDIFSP